MPESILDSLFSDSVKNIIIFKQDFTITFYYNIIYHIYILCNLNGFIQAESNFEQHVKNT